MQEEAHWLLLRYPGPDLPFNKVNRCQDQAQQCGSKKDPVTPAPGVLVSIRQWWIDT